MPDTVEFTRMIDGTQADYDLLDRHERAHVSGLADRILDALRGLENSIGGYKVSRLTHSLQTATMAEADGADIEMIVGALIHDIGDDLATENHSQMAAAIIRPYVRPEVTWVIQMHGLFQMAYYADKRGQDPNGRDAYRDHPYYESCVRFCERWDQEAFDPGYPTKPLEHFEPMLREVFGRAAFDPAIVGAEGVRPAV